jgi:ectoine hydroxylase-related dioxygenase (phytanoyl-CoA dioxygenase family)
VTDSSVPAGPEDWHCQGYFIVPQFLRAEEVRLLRRACDPVLDQVRGRSAELGHTTTHVGGMTDPAYFEGREVDLRRLMEFVGSARVCGLICPLGSALTGTPRLKNTHYYHEPSLRDWEGDWHRDSQFGRPDPSRERELMASATAVHFRVAFCFDDRLELVPGSHARWDTPEEHHIRKGRERNTARMPGAVRVALSPGDACVFHAWSIHRGSYRRVPIRRTFDALFEFAGAPPDPFATARP